jgi:adenylyltransferase/sulfurtransferase
MSGLPDPETTAEVSVEDVDSLAEAIESGGIVLLDCREDDEWEINRLPNARLAPLSRFATAAAEALGNGNTPCIIYCHHGMRSLRATEWLRSHGHSRVWSMQGGIHAWSERIDPDVPKY